MRLRSAIYAGHVVHTRLRPRRHSLHYRVFSLLLDLDELPALGRLSRLFGVNRHGIFSFWETDHGDGRAGGLRAWVEAQLAAAGIAMGRPGISMLCYPRMFGYVFNPLTVYFCSDAEGRLRAILYEVCNTFGERHTYVIRAGQDGGAVEHSCAKAMYVSPFVPMDCDYHFHIEPPGERVLVRIDETDGEGLLLRAAFAGERQPLSGAALGRALLAYPLMTLKIMGAIHWEALKLWRKGVPLFRHKAAATRFASSVVREKPDS
ncbi:DUF1365 domain-containing protein [uncultured Devosia sp.]|uniref:DUF1365 domain-containing protein n=1 Tax=uncultured Devosia sp. TaxID=211434 RepID=UPI0035CA8D02